MAHLVPSDLLTGHRPGASPCELDTARYLEQHLSDAFTVFHGVHWTRLLKRGVELGEVDFIVVNRFGDVLVIEQKNGALEETSTGIWKRYPDRRKEVSSQIHRSLGAIRQKFNTANPGAHLTIDHLLYCPDHEIRSTTTAGIDPTRIVDSRQRAFLAEKVEHLLGEGSVGNEPHAKCVCTFFRNCFDAVPDVHAFVSEHRRNFTRLTGGLVELLDGIEMRPLRLRVLGTAGCGKTQIAVRLLERAYDSGKHALYVCLSRPLAERMHGVLPAACFAGTWYALLHRFCDSRGHQLDFSRGATEATWAMASDIVLSSAIPQEWCFDAVVVDEAQDLERSMYENLRMFVADDADIVILEDPDQNIAGRPPLELDGFVGFRCRKNFRSPTSIASFVQDVTGVDFECANDLPGLGVGVHSFATAQKQRARLSAVLTKLVKDGFKPEDIVVLTTCHTVRDGYRRSIFQDQRAVGSFPLRRFTGEYDMFGNQLLSEGKIRFDSLYRFKGQQAPAVVVVDVDRNFHETEPRARAALFSAMTRATVRLELIVAEDHPEHDRFVAAAR